MQHLPRILTLPARFLREGTRAPACCTHGYGSHPLLQVSVHVADCNAKKNPQNQTESNRIESNGRQEAEEKEARGEAVAAPGALRMGLWRGLIWGRTSLGNAARLVYNSLAVPVAGAAPLDYRETKLPLNTEKLIETLFRCGLGGRLGRAGGAGVRSLCLCPLRCEVLSPCAYTASNERCLIRT